MFSFLRKIFTPSVPAPDALAVQAEIRRLQLALSEEQARSARLEAEITRLQRQSQELGAEALAARTSALFNDLAAPAAQFSTQLYLTEEQGREVQGRDALAVARTLLRALQNHGLEITVAPGTQVLFDPDHHEPLAIGAGATMRNGQPGLVRTPGLAYQGRLLRKAGVAPVEPAEEGA